MNPRTTAILGVLVAGLAAFIWFYEIEGEDERAEAKAAEGRVFQDVDAEAFESLWLRTSDGQEVQLERVDGAWRLVTPIEFAADTVTVDGLVQALADLPAEERYEDPAPLAEYGLGAEPSLRATEGGRERVLRLGDESPVAGNRYLATAEDAPVYVVQTYRTRVFEKSLDELREKRILDFERDAVQTIRLRWPGGGVGLARQQGDWQLVEPLAVDADDRAVDRLLSDLGFLRATGFVDQPGAEEEASLAVPALEAELLGAAVDDGAAPRLASLAVGEPLGDETRLARSAAAQAWFRISAERIDDFPRDVDAYRFKELSSFIATDAERFELVFHDGDGGQTHAVEGRSADPGWETSPDVLDPGKVSRLIAELSHLEAARIAADSMGEGERAALGLVPPRVAMRVFGAEDAVLADVALGIDDPDRGIAASRADSDAVYWLSPDLAEHLPLSEQALRATFLAPTPDPNTPQT